MTVRMTLDEFYRAVSSYKPDFVSSCLKPKRKNKYGAKPVQAYGLHFPSTIEKEFHDLCLLRQKVGEIKYFHTHVPIRIPGGTKLAVDKMLVYPNGEIEYIDVKGKLTKDFLIKKREIEFHYPFKIKIARKKKRRWEITDE